MIYIVKHYYIVRREIENSPRNALLLRIVGNLLQVKQTKAISVSFVDRKKKHNDYFMQVFFITLVDISKLLHFMVQFIESSEGIFLQPV